MKFDVLYEDVKGTTVHSILIYGTSLWRRKTLLYVGSDCVI